LVLADGICLSLESNPNHSCHALLLSIDSII
jgi:hypothetical protein